MTDINSFFHKENGLKNSTNSQNFPAAYQFFSSWKGLLYSSNYFIYKCDEKKRTGGPDSYANFY